MAVEEAIDWLRPVVQKIGTGIEWIASHIAEWTGLNQPNVELIILILGSIWLARIIYPRRYRVYSRIGFWIIVGVLIAIFKYLGL